MNIIKTINIIVEKRMKHIRVFPGDTFLIEQELRIAVADAIQATLNDLVQTLPAGNVIDIRPPEVDGAA